MEDYKRYTSKDGATLTMSQWGGSPAELELYRKLAELEDKIENGTLVELPCKVGDDVYMLPYAGDKITSFKATAIGYWGNGVWKLIIPSGFFAEWGWAAFPTKKDAEKRLKIVKIADKLIKNGSFQGLSLREAVNKIVGQKRTLDEIASE